MKRWPRAILLDFYGTVADDGDCGRALIFSEIARVACLRVSLSQLERDWGKRFASKCRHSHGDRFCLQSTIATDSLREMLEHFRVDLDAVALVRHELDAWSRPRLYPEAAEVLARCPVPVCLVSNIDNTFLTEALAFNGLAFDFVVTSEDVQAYKPHPAPFQRALEMLSCQPREVLHVGDSRTSDLLGAQTLGIPAMWINRDRRHLPVEYAVDFVARDLNGLLTVL
jgi:2-haloacid dehalogenase/putative hydrolase of the HAD superfamily